MQAKINIRIFEDIEEGDEIYFTTRRYKEICLGKAVHLLSSKDFEVEEDIWLTEYKGEVFTVSKEQFKQFKGYKNE